MTMTHLPDLPRRELLCPSTLLPFLHDPGLLHRLLDRSGASAPRQLGKCVRGQDEMTVGEGLAGDGSGGAVDQRLEPGVSTS